jgi:N-acetylmuramoyl-L-alanine amidase
MALWGFGFSLLLPAVASARVAVHREAHRDPWEKAVALRDKLEASPPQQRTRERYEAVLDAFRAIYHQRPDSAKAPAAVAAVADLLAEKGRVLSDHHALEAAIGQYDFLRQQYPHSPQVDNALLLEAEICRQDLKDTACAKEKLHAVVDEQPNTSYSEQAALELKDLEPHKASNARSASRADRKTTHSAGNPSVRNPTTSNSTIARSNPAPEVVPPHDIKPSDSGSANRPEPAEPVTSASSQTASQSQALSADIETRPISATQQSERPTPPGKIVAITGMRHWSNPTSTRIAIDLGGKVEYEAARVPNPDRIFFDLHGARLASGLNGRQVEVIDDGFLKRIRAAQFRSDVTRVVLDVTDVSDYSAFLLPNPWRLIIDIHSDKSAGKIAAANGIAATIGPSHPAAPPHTDHPPTSAESTIADVAKLSTEPAKIQATAGPTSAPVSAKVPAADSKSADNSSTSDTTATAANNAPASTSSAAAKNRRKGKAGSTPDNTTAEAVPHAADPTSDGERSLVRALGLKVGRIVIDPGHGGHDSGTLGPGGIQEKDVVLDVALRVGKLLHERLGAQIVYTRDDDTFIPLETRTAIANRAQADLFLSIHANSSREPEARGVETYYLNFTSDPGALDVAARENAVSTQSVHQLSDLVRKIALKDKIDESREFAADVDAGLYSGLKKGNPGLRDRGVKKAPFVVLIGAQMPSILAEISFLTNPDDAEQLREGSYRQRIAESLDAGVERYLRGLSGMRPLEKNPSKSATRSAERSSVENSSEGAGR